jgi:predicted ester cyclase
MEERRDFMSAEQNKELIRKLCQAFNAGDFDHLIGTIFSPDMVYYHNGRRGDVHKWIKDSRDCLVSFPGAQVILDSMEAEGNLVSTRLKLDGKHTGPMGSVPPTGKSFSLPGLTKSRIVDGLIVEIREEVDDDSLLQQLGLR